MELYLKPASMMLKSAQWYNPSNWFSGSRNQNGVVNPSKDILPYNVSPLPPESSNQNNPGLMQLVQDLSRDYHTLSRYINVLTQEYRAYKDALNPLYSTFTQMLPSWQQFRQKTYNDPQFAAQINQVDLESASQSMKKVLPMIARMMSEQKKDQMQAVEIIRNAQPAFDAIAKLVGAKISPMSPVKNTTQPVSISNPQPANLETPKGPYSMAPGKKPRGFQRGNIPWNKGKIRQPAQTVQQVPQAVARTIKLFPKLGSSYSYIPNLKISTD